MKKLNKKMTRIERVQHKKEMLAYYQKGTGLYLFRNRSDVATLELPKTSSDGKRWVGPKETWEGDSYFLSMIPKEAVLVKEILEPQTENKEENMETKLILDQPDQVTTAGKVEHKVAQGDLPLNETTPQDTNEKERLLTEDPLAGVTIIRD